VPETAPAAVQHVKDDGYRTVTAKLYPGMRHELLNHTNHMDIYRDLLALFDSWI
jgi:alpha-beta hydrolase superfamily lysophospholipase